MTRSGTVSTSLLDGLHASGCVDGKEYSTCQAITVDDPEDRGETFHVILMQWCGDCGAAEWDFV